LRLLLALTAMVVRAQSPSDDGPVIRTSTRLVEVNVIVHDRNGPVADLTKDDFILTDRGKTRRISLFSVESVTRPGKVVEPPPPNTFSNRVSGAGPANVTVVLLDGLNTKFEDQAYAKRQLLKFLKGVDPKDRIAIYTLGKGLRILCDFTDGPEELRKILAAFRGSTGADVIAGEIDPANTGNPAFDQFLDQSNQTLAEASTVDRARTTLTAFAAIAGHLADLPGRKTLVWVTGSLPFSLAGAAKVFTRANISVYPVDARGLVGLPRQLTASAPSPRNRGAPPVIPTFRPDGLDTMQ